MKKYLLFIISMSALLLLAACGDVSPGHGNTASICVKVENEEFCGKWGDWIEVECIYFGSTANGEPKSCSTKEHSLETTSDGGKAKIFNAGTYVSNSDILYAGFFVSSFLTDGIPIVSETEITFNGTDSTGAVPYAQTTPSHKWAFKQIGVYKVADILDKYGTDTTVEIELSYYNPEGVTFPIDPAVAASRLYSRGILRFTVQEP